MIETSTAGMDPQPVRGLAARLIRHARENLAAVMALCVRIGAAGLAYLLQIVLARVLGATDYGTFSFAWNIITIAGFLATLGFGQIAIRFLAQYQQTGEHGLAHGFLRHAFITTIAGSIGAMSLLYLLFPLVERGYGALCCSILAIGLLGLPFFALTDLFEGIARSQGWTIRALFPPYILRQGAIILVLFGAIAIGAPISIGFVMLSALFATILAAAVQFLLLMRPLRAMLPAATPVARIADWKRASRPTLLSEIALLARQNIDLLVLGLLAPPHVVGIYFAATRIASLLGLIDFAIGAAFGHRFARAMAEGGPAALSGVFAAARRLTMLPGLCAGVVLMLSAPLILALFGDEFRAGAAAAIVLLGAGTLRMLLGPVEDTLAMSGFPDAVWRANMIGALTTATICLALCASYGALGAAIGAAAGSVAASASLGFAVRRLLGFSPLARSEPPR